MKDASFTLPVQVRTNARAKLAFDRVVANLRASDAIRWKGKRATKEAAFAAVWLWLEGLDPAIVEEAVAAQMDRLEAIQAGEPDPGPRLTLDRSLVAVAEDEAPAAPPEGRGGTATPVDPATGQPLRRPRRPRGESA